MPEYKLFQLFHFKQHDNLFRYYFNVFIARYRNNFLRVLIYFEDLNYETITEEPMYEVKFNFDFI